VGAAPVDPNINLYAVAAPTAPMTILGVDLRVVQKVPLPLSAIDTLIECGYGAGGYAGEVLYMDFDHPKSPLTMQNTALGPNDPGGALVDVPPGNIVVAANQAESPNIEFKGTNGYVYAYTLTIHMVENGRQGDRQLGTTSEPLLYAFGPQRVGLLPHTPRYVDWDFGSHQWITANYR
jgi:hypothetical protein